MNYQQVYIFNFYLLLQQRNSRVSNFLQYIVVDEDNISGQWEIYDLSLSHWLGLVAIIIVSLV